MKNLFSLIMSILFALPLSVQADETITKQINTVKIFHDYKVYQSIPENWNKQDPLKDFMKGNSFISKHQGKQYIFFVGMAYADNKETARDFAKANGRVQLASALKEITKTQMTVVEQKVGKQVINEKIKQLLETKTVTDVEAGGVMETVKYDVGTQIDEKEDKVVYVCKYLYSLDYQEFKKRRLQALKELVRENILPLKTVKIIAREFSTLDKELALLLD